MTGEKETPLCMGDGARFSACGIFTNPVTHQARHAASQTNPKKPEIKKPDCHRTSDPSFQFLTHLWVSPTFGATIPRFPSSRATLTFGSICGLKKLPDEKVFAVLLVVLQVIDWSFPLSIKSAIGFPHDSINRPTPRRSCWLYRCRPWGIWSSWIEADS